MAFIDEATITVRAGRGGDGSVSFRREKFVPMGGPDGGDGGAGGSVILISDPHLSTLMDFRYRRVCRAEAGDAGRGKRQSGRSGADLVLPVPVGTVVRDADSGELIVDLVAPGQSICAARGGRGGRGNTRFAGPTRQTPRYAQPGGPGEERTITLELKLLADVGLVGPPNAGKSTLLSRVSDAKPRIAAYPFTTLRPMLGVVKRERDGFVVADIPGIIEGAHQGKGMGLDFLRHIERTRIIAVLVDVADPDPLEAYRSIREELRAHDESLWRRPHCVVLTKRDLLPPDVAPPSLEGGDAYEVYCVSSVSGFGIEALMAAFAGKLAELGRADPDDGSEAPDRAPGSTPGPGHDSDSTHRSDSPAP